MKKKQGTLEIEMKVVKRRRPLKLKPIKSCIDLRVETKLFIGNSFECHHASLVIQSWMRSRKAYWGVWGPSGVREQTYCRNIQRVFRGYKGKLVAKHIKKELLSSSALVLEQFWRCVAACKTRKSMLQKKRDENSTVIQKNVRGRFGRLVAFQCRHRRDVKCTRTIQRIFRGFYAKKRVETKRKTYESKMNFARTLYSLYQERRAIVSDREYREEPALIQSHLEYSILCILAGNYRTSCLTLQGIIRVTNGNRIASCALALSTAARSAQFHRHFNLESIITMCKNRKDDGIFVFDDMDELFYMYIQAQQGHHRNHFQALVNYAIYLGIVSGQTGRALKYWERAAGVMTIQKQRNLKLVPKFTEEWFDRLRSDFHDHWKCNLKFVGTMNNIQIQRKGQLVYFEYSECIPLVVDIKQVHSVTFGEEFEFDYEFKWDHSFRIEILSNFIRRVRVVKTSKGLRLMHPLIHKLIRIQEKEMKMKMGSVEIQRMVRGKLARIVATFLRKVRQEKQNQLQILEKKQLEKQSIRDKRKRASMVIQAQCRRKLWCDHLRSLHERAVSIQRVGRGCVGRVRGKKLKRQKLMGVLVDEVYTGGKNFKVKSGVTTRDCQVLLQGFKSGFSYLFVAKDMCTCREYKGTISGQQLETFLEEFNNNKSKSQRIRKTQEKEVLQILIAHLRLIPPIKGIGALASSEGQGTLALSLND